MPDTRPSTGPFPLHEDGRKTLAEFIERHRITATVAKAKSNPNSPGTWGPDALHFRVTLHRGGHPGGPARSTMVVPFSGGSRAFSRSNGRPTMADVLGCLAMDAASYENADADFEGWASDYGYDTDSRKAERIFAAVGRQTAELRAFLGDRAYNELLWEVDSDV